MPDYSKYIDAAKQKAINALKLRMGEMESAAYEIMMQSIEEIFDIKAGMIVQDKDFVKKLNQLTGEVLNVLQETPKFTGPVSELVKRMPAISDAISVFQKATNNIIVPAFEVSKKIVIDETLDQMLNNGLNQNFVQPLRDLIYQNASGGLTMKEARKQIEEFIKGGNDKSGKLGSYIEQTSIQAVDSYSGTINKKLVETFDYDGLLITGSLIDNSSPQCRYAIEKLDGQITRDNWKEVEAIGKKFKGWIEGTTFDNVALNRLHHGCRHSFYPIIIKKAA